MSGGAQPCAGGVVLNGPAGQRRLLLIRRGRAPALGRWSVPGGRCHPGESASDACVRELREETALRVEPLRLLGRVERDAPDGGVYLIDDFLCRLVAGTARAGDDADGVRWVTLAELDALPLSPGLRDALAEWSVLPD